MRRQKSWVLSMGLQPLSHVTLDKSSDLYEFIRFLTDKTSLERKIISRGLLFFPLRICDFPQSMTLVPFITEDLLYNLIILNHTYNLDYQEFLTGAFG